MKRLIALLIIGFASLSAAQIKLKISAQGFPDSNANFTQKLLSDGSKQVQLSVEINSVDGRKVKVRVDRTYASTGVPIRVFSDTSCEKPKYHKTATATFNSNGAHVVIDENGKRTVRDVPLAVTAPRECISEFWFLRDKPKVGQLAKYYHFDIDKLDWTIVESEYVGKTNLRVDGKPVSAHHVRTSNGEAFLDDAGAPIKIVDASVTMVRVDP